MKLHPGDLLFWGGRYLAYLALQPCEHQVESGWDSGSVSVAGLLNQDKRFDR